MAVGGAGDALRVGAELDSKHGFGNPLLRSRSDDVGSEEPE